MFRRLWGYLVHLFTANLAAFFTVNPVPYVTDNVEDLIENGHKACTYYNRIHPTVLFNICPQLKLANTGYYNISQIKVAGSCL